MILSKTYESKSKGLILISEMEAHHLKNAIAKLRGLRAAGLPYSEEVLNDLEREQAVRSGYILDHLVGTTESNVIALPVPTAETTTTQPAPPMPVAMKEACLNAGKFINFVTTKLQDGGSDLSEVQLQKLTDAINAALTPQPEVVPVTCTAPASVVLNNLPPVAYRALSSKLLVNSLVSYGIVTLADLATISASDFGAIRFSTAEAFMEATQLLHKEELDWNKSSSILSADGHINEVLNPNASAISVFVEEAENRLMFAYTSSYTAYTRTQQIARIFEGIKRRVALAVRVVGTLLLAQGRTRTPFDCIDTSSSMLLRSTAFKHQVRLYLTRINQRINRLQPNNSTEEVAANLTLA